MKRKSSKRSSERRDVARLQDIPNVGPAIAADLRRLGITSPDASRRTYLIASDAEARRFPPMRGEHG
jgi:hypothetical protein